MRLIAVEFHRLLILLIYFRTFRLELGPFFSSSLRLGTRLCMGMPNDVHLDAMLFKMLVIKLVLTSFQWLINRNV